MNGYLIDSNVLIDVATHDPIWQPWSEVRVLEAIAQNLAFINPIIYAEVARTFDSQEVLDLWLNDTKFQRLALPYEAGWRAGQAFVRYRRAGGTKTSPLPDFYIGAHAEVTGLTLVTRDMARYATYFPAVSLMTP